jgi:hypothetical protein
MARSWSPARMYMPATLWRRAGTVALQPYTAIQSTDILRSIDNVVIPWTQQFRITARSATTGRPLSGDEIRSQLRFNFVGALVTQVGDFFVDLTVRGSTTANRTYYAQTSIEDIPGACS